MPSENILTVTLPEMHPAQLSIFQDTHRFKVVPKGRRFGGSLLGTIEAIAEMLKGGYAWLVCPTAENARERWEELKALARQLDGTEIREEPRTIAYRGKGMIAVKSAQSYNNLRGSGVTKMVLDEFAYWDKASYIWRQILRPMLAVSRGSALFLSSPNGVGNEFHRLASWGDDPLRPDWVTLPRKTSDNPLISPQEIADMRAEMSYEEARQELDAAFIDLSGSIFKHVDTTAVLQDKAVEGHKYLIGCDIARSVDHSVYCVVDITLRQLVYLDRQPHTEFSLQVKRLKLLCDRFHPDSVLIEQNNAGSAFVELAHREGIQHLQAITTSNASKAAWVESLVIDFERDNFSVIPDPTLISEMGTFISLKTASGLTAYRAAGQNKDDCVLAMLIAHSGISHKRSHGGFSVGRNDGDEGLPAEKVARPGQYIEGLGYVYRDDLEGN